MKHFIKQTVLLVGMLLIVAGTTVPASANALPVTQFAAKCTGNLMGFPYWYAGLECEGTKPTLVALTDIWIVALNAVQWLVLATGYVALTMIILGGFRYMTSGGSLGNDKSPGKIAAAKNTIISAIVVLIIALSAIMIIKYIQQVLTTT